MGRLLESAGKSNLLKVRDSYLLSLGLRDQDRIILHPSLTSVALYEKGFSNPWHLPQRDIRNPLKEPFLRICEKEYHS